MNSDAKGEKYFHRLRKWNLSSFILTLLLTSSPIDPRFQPQIMCLYFVTAFVCSHNVVERIPCEAKSVDFPQFNLPCEITESYRRAAGACGPCRRKAIFEGLRITTNNSLRSRYLGGENGWTINSSNSVKRKPALGNESAANRRTVIAELETRTERYEAYTDESLRPAPLKLKSKARPKTDPLLLHPTILRPADPRRRSTKETQVKELFFAHRPALKEPRPKTNEGLLNHPTILRPASPRRWSTKETQDKELFFAHPRPRQERNPSTRSGERPHSLVAGRRFESTFKATRISMIPTHYSFSNLRTETLSTCTTEPAAGLRSSSPETAADLVSPMSSIAGPGWEIFIPSPPTTALPSSIPIPTPAPAPTTTPAPPEAPETETYEWSTAARASRLFELPGTTEIRGDGNRDIKAGPDIPDSQRFILPIRGFPPMRFEGTVLEGIV